MRSSIFPLYFCYRRQCFNLSLYYYVSLYLCFVHIFEISRNQGIIVDLVFVFFFKYQKLIFFLPTGEPSRAYGSRASGVSLLVQPAHCGPVIASGLTKYVLNKQTKAAMFGILTHNLYTILIYQISSHVHKPIHHYPHFINQESLKDEQQQHRLCIRIQICTFPLGLTQRLPHFTSHLYRINANLQGNMLTSTIDKK